MFVSDFSLTSWAAGKGLDLANPLPEVYISLLKEGLGIAVYLQQDVCDLTMVPYSPHVNGWKDGKVYNIPTDYYRLYFLPTLKFKSKTPCFTSLSMFDI